MAYTSPGVWITYTKGKVVDLISDVLLLLPETKDTIADTLTGNGGTQTDLTAFPVTLDEPEHQESAYTSDDDSDDMPIEKDADGESSENAMGSKDARRAAEAAEDEWNDRVKRISASSHCVMLGVVGVLLVALFVGMYYSNASQTRARMRVRVEAAIKALREELRHVTSGFLPIDSDGVDEGGEGLYMDLQTLETISELPDAPKIDYTHVWNLLLSTQVQPDPNGDVEDLFVPLLLSCLGAGAVCAYVVFLHFKIPTKRAKVAVRVCTALLMWGVVVTCAYVNRDFTPVVSYVMLVAATVVVAVPIKEILRYLRCVSRVTVLDSISGALMGVTARPEELDNDTIGTMHIHPTLLYTPERVQEVYLASKGPNAQKSGGRRSSDAQLQSSKPKDQPGFWCNRMIPKLLTRSDLSHWVPSIRRELCAPFFAFPFSIVMVTDYAMYLLTPRQFTDAVCCCLGVLWTARALLHESGLSWLVFVIASSESVLTILFLHRLQARIDQVYPSLIPVKPLWPAALAVYSAFTFMYGCTADDRDFRWAYLLSSVLTFGLNMPYIVLSLIQIETPYLTKLDVLTSTGAWIRTPAGEVAIVLQAFFYTTLYVFALSAGELFLISVAMFGLGLSIVMAPIQRRWCVLFHLPIAFLLLVSSMHLDTLDKGLLLRTLEKYLSGMFLEYANLLLDIHYVATLGGLVAMYSAAGNLFHEYWEFYLSQTSMTRGARWLHASVYFLVMYTICVLLTAFSAIEEHSLLHALYSLSALGFLLFGMQPFSPYILNTQSTRKLVSKTVQIDKVQDIIKGDFDMDEYMEELRESGMKSLKKNATGAANKRAGRKLGSAMGLLGSNSSSSDDDDADGSGGSDDENTKDEEYDGLLKAHPCPIYGWPAVYMVVGIRVALMASDTFFVHLGAVLVCTTGILGIYFHSYSILVTSALFVWLGYNALLLEARLMAIISVLGCFIMAYVATMRYGASANVFVLIGLGGIAAQYQLVTYLEGAEALQSQDGNGTGVYVERVLAQWAVEYLMTFFGEITD